MKTRAIGLAMMLACLAAAPASAQAPQAAQETNLSQLSWLTGHWRRQGPVTAGGSVRFSEETWTDAQAGMMLGVGRSGSTFAPGHFEFLRIAMGPEGRLAYFASPDGAPVVRFDLVQASASSVTFENRTHDFPQRITYRREGDALHASISLADGSREQSWTWQLQPPRR